jgi:phosphopantothenoylcysteine decarboxylase/phosphopantothenate--cysteine ligase
MGFALADVAAELGAEVILITGKTHLEAKRNVKRIDVESAEEMFVAAKRYFQTLDVFVAAAAVADYRPSEIHNGKMKKTADEMSIALVKNPDILLEFGKVKQSRQFSIGFALEIQDALANAKAKLLIKNCDMIALNSASEIGAGFEVETNIITLILKSGEVVAMPRLSKRDAAKAIFEKASFFFEKSSLTLNRQ